MRGASPSTRLGLDTGIAIGLGALFVSVGWVGFEPWLRWVSHGLQLVVRSPDELGWFRVKFAATWACPAVMTWAVGLWVRIARREAPSLAELGVLLATLVFAVGLRVGARVRLEADLVPLLSVDGLSPVAGAVGSAALISIAGLVVLVRRRRGG